MKASPWSILPLAFAVPAFAADLPLNPAVTQETIATTICVPGWTKTVRPSARYTAAIKIKLIRELEIPEELPPPNATGDCGSTRISQRPHGCGMGARRTVDTACQAQRREAQG
jgi:hypothetical protein